MRPIGYGLSPTGLQNRDVALVPEVQAAHKGRTEKKVHYRGALEIRLDYLNSLTLVVCRSKTPQ